MDCSRCGLCCEKTEMVLTDADVRHLEEMGYDRSKFARFDRHGFAGLRNRVDTVFLTMLKDTGAEFMSIDLWDVEYIQWYTVNKKE